MLDYPVIERLSTTEANDFIAYTTMKGGKKHLTIIAKTDRPPWDAFDVRHDFIIWPTVSGTARSPEFVSQHITAYGADVASVDLQFTRSGTGGENQPSFASLVALDLPRKIPVIGYLKRIDSVTPELQQALKQARKQLPDHFGTDRPTLDTLGEIIGRATADNTGHGRSASRAYTSWRHHKPPGVAEDRGLVGSLPKYARQWAPIDRLPDLSALSWWDGGRFLETIGSL